MQGESHSTGSPKNSRHTLETDLSITERDIMNTNLSNNDIPSLSKTVQLIALALIILFITVPTLAQDQAVDLKGVAAATLDDEKLAQIDAYVADTMTRFAMPGATIAIVQDGKIIHRNGFGVKELGKDSPVTPDTLFMIGSVPKAMTSLMMGTLVDEGIIDWDMPVSKILPPFKLADDEASQTVTFRDLLSMRSGLSNFDLSLFIHKYTAEQIFESLRDIPLVDKPGKQYAYSNQGYSAAAYIAAIASGATYGKNLYETYAELMQKRVFDPIGMKNTLLEFNAGVKSANVASPHRPNLAGGGFETFSVELERGGFSIIPAGGTTWSTADDLARYLITEMNHGVTPDGKQIVSEARLLDTWKPEIPSMNNNHYALGWVVRPGYHGLQQIEYGGGNLGYTSFVSFLPEAKLGVVVLTNRLGGDSFTAAVTDYVYETAFGLAHEADAGYTANEQGLQSAVAQISSEIQMQVDPKSVAAFVGQYGPDLSVHVDDKGNLVTTVPFGDMPMYGIPNQPRTFVLGLTIGLIAEFAEDGSSVTIATLPGMGAPQPPVTVAKGS